MKEKSQMKPTPTTKPTRARKASRSRKVRAAEVAAIFAEHGLPQPGSTEDETALAFAATYRALKALPEIIDSMDTRIQLVEAKIELRNRKDAELMKKITRLEKRAANGRSLTKKDLGELFEEVRDTLTEGFATVAGANLMGPVKSVPGIVRELVAEGIGVKQEFLG